MKTLSKKLKRAFTITELVIVIAVIAILAAVLIPTLSGVVSRARQSVAMQEARSEWTNYYADIAADSHYDEKDTYYIVHYDDGKEDYYFTVENGQFNTTANEYNEKDTWLKGCVYEGLTSTKEKLVRIYTNDAVTAVTTAATTAENAIGTTAGTYYVKVNVTSKGYTFYLKLVYSGSTWTETETWAESDYNTAVKALTSATATTSTAQTGYTITYYTAS